MAAAVSRASLSVAEMKEFATFAASTQRYICRSLDVFADKPGVTGLWARDVREQLSIRQQRALYARLAHIRKCVPDGGAIADAEPLLATLTGLTAFDLAYGELPSFAAYRFLYERLVGGRVRPWLPSAFLAAAALPIIHPATRKSLLRSVSENVAMAPGWSILEPAFYPTWVDQVEP